MSNNVIMQFGRPGSAVQSSGSASGGLLWRKISSTFSSQSIGAHNFNDFDTGISVNDNHVCFIPIYMGNPRLYLSNVWESNGNYYLTISNSSASSQSTTGFELIELYTA